MSRELVMAMITVVCMFAAMLLFLRGVRSRSAQPHLWAWIVRVLITCVALWSQMSMGATYSLMLSICQVVIGTIMLVVICKWVRPLVLRPTVLDVVMLALASAGMYVLITTSHAEVGIISVIVADSCATIMGIRAALKKGSTESIAFWVWCGIAAGASLGAAMATGGNGLFWIALPPLFSSFNAIANVATVLHVRRRTEIRLQVECVGSSAAL